MKRRAITVTLVVGSLAAGLLAGCATGDQKMMMGSGDIVADRQRIMKLNGASWADAQAKIKAGNFEAVAVNAETMALNAEHIPMLFPKGSLTDKSKAKPEVWENRRRWRPSRRTSAATLAAPATPRSAFRLRVRASRTRAATAAEGVPTGALRGTPRA